jgi:hypothetical protein
MIEIRPAQFADAEELTYRCFSQSSAEQTRDDLQRALGLAEEGEGTMSRRLVPKTGAPTAVRLR